MDMSYIESWVSQPDVCRCCLSASGTWDVTASYITETGDKEVYADMLQECYGITLSYLMQFGPSRMVCGLCVGHLRGASSFRKQVLQAEQQFLAYWGSTRRVFNPVVLKVAEPPQEKDDNSNGSNKVDSDDGTIDVLTLTDPTERNVIDRMKRKTNGTSLKGKRKRQKIELNEEVDSDTPISELSRKNNVTESVAETAGDDIFDLESVASSEIVPKKPKKKAKPVKPSIESHINNKELRANITLLLKHTAITPFQYNNSNQFVCLYCDKPHLFFGNLKNHVKIRHCNLTDKQISRTIKLPKELIKADVSDISCRLCGSHYNTIEKLLEHLKLLHDKKYTQVPGLKYWHGILGFDLSEGKMKCYICRQEFDFFKNLSMHMNEHDTDYICYICGKRFVAEHRLQLHVDRHKPLDLKCEHCNKEFKSASTKHYHIRQEHTNPITYKCPECPQEFQLYSRRLKHMVECHKFKKPEFKCKHCSKDFATPSALSAHIKHLHFKSENMKYVCEICDKAFCYKWIMERHLSVHTGRKNFECEYCSKKFAKKYTLKVHVKSHLNEKKYACSLCDAAFVQKCSLKAHINARHKYSGIDIDAL